MTKDDTLILRGKGTQEDVEKRIGQIQDEYDASTSDYEKVKHRYLYNLLILRWKNDFFETFGKFRTQNFRRNSTNVLPSCPRVLHCSKLAAPARWK